MSKAATHALVGLVLLLAVAAAGAGWRMNAARTAALRAGADLAATRADLADLDAWHVTTSAAADGGPEASDLNRRIRSAAATVGLVDHVVSVEPGPTVRVRDTDTVRTPIYLRVENVTLRQLVAFLQGLTAADAAARVTGIDLSAPPVTVGPTGPDLWIADVTISESAVAPAGGF